MITLAFALFVTGMKLLQAHAAVTLGAVGFLALVGGLQMAFDQSPRQASMIAGGLLVPSTVLVLWIAGDGGLLSGGGGSGFLPVLEVAFSLARLSVAGAAVGYAIGILVGSVFMVAAALRRLRRMGRRGTMA